MKDFLVYNYYRTTSKDPKKDLTKYLYKSEFPFLIFIKIVLSKYAMFLITEKKITGCGVT